MWAFYSKNIFRSFSLCISSDFPSYTVSQPVCSGLQGPHDLAFTYQSKLLSCFYGAHSASATWTLLFSPLWTPSAHPDSRAFTLVFTLLGIAICFLITLPQSCLCSNVVSSERFFLSILLNTTLVVYHDTPLFISAAAHVMGLICQIHQNVYSIGKALCFACYYCSSRV